MDKFFEKMLNIMAHKVPCILAAWHIHIVLITLFNGRLNNASIIIRK